MSTVIHDDVNPLRIELRSGTAGRLFGLPFLAVGAYLAYHLAGGLLDLTTGHAALGEMLPGTLLLLLFTAAFLIPGWLLLLSVARIEIDRVARSVTYVRDLRVYQHRVRHPLDRFIRIEVGLLSVSPNRRSSARVYQLELAGPGSGRITVGLTDGADEAERLGQRLGALLGLSVLRREADGAADD